MEKVDTSAIPYGNNKFPTPAFGNSSTATRGGGQKEKKEKKENGGKKGKKTGGSLASDRVMNYVQHVWKKQ
jgi:hypothetical protein